MSTKPDSDETFISPLSLLPRAHLPKTKSTIAKRRPVMASRKVCNINLIDCFQDMVAVNSLSGSSQYLCTPCKSKQDAERRDLFSNMPQILLVHLNRAVWSARGREKLNTYIDFPLDNLDFSQFCDANAIIGPDCNLSNMTPVVSLDNLKPFNLESIGTSPPSISEYRYRLISIVCHIGHSLDQGHYISVGYNSELNEWISFNDSKVNIISINEVKKLEAYILFYERYKK